GTGFRSEEMQSLTRESFDLDGPCPTITIEAKDSKRRRRDVQPIQPALAALLKPWLVARPKGQPLFPVDRWAILAALQGDLKDAGIPYENEEGFADFHALRDFSTTAGDYRRLARWSVSIVCRREAPWASRNMSSAIRPLIVA